MSDHYGDNKDLHGDAADSDATDTTPAQVGNDVAPDKPEPDEAGEGAENSANPVTDEAHPDNLNTMGW